MMSTPSKQIMVRRGFLQASGLVLSGTAIALLAGREALATEVQNVPALRRGIDETHRRFEDMFNRGDAAGAARQLYTRDARILPPGAETVRGRDRIAEYWAAAAGRGTSWSGSRRMAPGAGARTSGTWTQRDEAFRRVHGAGGYGLRHLRRGGPARRHAPRRGSLFALPGVPCVGGESHRTAPLRALRQTGWQRAGIRVFGGNEALGHCVERCYARRLPRRSLAGCARDRHVRRCKRCEGARRSHRVSRASRSLGGLQGGAVRVNEILR